MRSPQSSLGRSPVAAAKRMRRSYGGLAAAARRSTCSAVRKIGSFCCALGSLTPWHGFPLMAPDPLAVSRIWRSTSRIFCKVFGASPVACFSAKNRRTSTCSIWLTGQSAKAGSRWTRTIRP